MFSVFFWGLLIFLLLFSMLAINPLLLGFCILGVSFVISLLVSYFLFSWYAFIFFLMYVGGLLVLFFYISSLSNNPVFSLSMNTTYSDLKLKNKSFLNIFWFFVSFLSKKMVYFFVLFSFFCYSWKSVKVTGIFVEKHLDFCVNLFGLFEVWFLFMVIFVLLLVLWMITKLTFFSRGALRPFF